MLCIPQAPTTHLVQLTSPHPHTCGHTQRHTIHCLHSNCIRKSCTKHEISNCGCSSFHLPTLPSHLSFYSLHSPHSLHTHIHTTIPHIPPLSSASFPSPCCPSWSSDPLLVAYSAGRHHSKYPTQTSELPETPVSLCKGCKTKQNLFHMIVYEPHYMALKVSRPAPAQLRLIESTTPQ